ncbi:MAG: DNA-binding protein [Lachnospiraceae bacterium]|nr:DNA-binding protein [Lachnospiraceae bacterium]
MERIVEQGLLYDFYGELLTEHQKKIYEDVVYNDLSLAEIAKESGISRQGVHDLVRRCNRILQDYEDKLHLVQRFMKIKDNIDQLQKLTADEELTREELVQRIGLLSRQILEEL